MKKKTLLPFSNFPKQPIAVITESSDSTLLVAIDGQGVWELDKDKKKVLNILKEDIDNPFSLRGDGVYDIFSTVSRGCGSLPILVGFLSSTGNLP